MFWLTLACAKLVRDDAHGTHAQAAEAMKAVVADAAAVESGEAFCWTEDCKVRRACRKKVDAMYDRKEASTRRSLEKSPDFVENVRSADPNNPQSIDEMVENTMSHYMVNKYNPRMKVCRDGTLDRIRKFLNRS